MSPRLALGLLLAVCTVQWAIPLGLIWQHERTLSRGTAYDFRTAPVDPIDPFRGRYVALQFEAEQFALRPGERLPDDLRYAPVEIGPEGEARLGTPRRAPPADGDYLRVRLRWQNNEQALLQLPFDRYYLDERLAPIAERLYWEAERRRAEDGGDGVAEDPRRPSYARVRIHRGHAVIEELFIDGLPVRQRVREAQDAPHHRPS